MLHKRHSVAKGGQIFLTLRRFFNSLAQTVLSGRALKNAGTAGMVVMVSLTGCATLTEGARNSGAESVVEARAQARWDALVKGNVGDAYAYLGPGIRATMSQTAYQGRIRLGTWSKAKVSSVSCEAERCNVAVQIELRSLGGLQVQEPLREVWVKEGGEWWYFWKK